MFILKKKSSPEPAVQLQSNLVQTYLAWLEFKFSQMKVQVLFNGRNIHILFILFVCFESHEQFFSYLATVTITSEGAANLDLVCLALTAFSSESSFTCHTYCDTRPPFLRSYPKDPWFYLLNAVLGAITTYFNRLRFDAASLSGARTHDLPSAKREHYH
jgi:hypothetical protein